MLFDSLFHKNSFLPRLTPILCLLCVASFIGLNLNGGANISYAHSNVFGLFPTESVWTGAPWALLTSTFAHIQIYHVLFNVMWLWTLGNAFEDRFGSLRWAAFFLGAAWVSSALQLLGSGDIGIGMSGVGYALFGFGWIARRRVPAFAAILTQQNVVIFLLWLVGCIVATQLGLASIGNWAHVAGMAFGAAVAGLLVEKWKPVLSGLGLVILVGLSFVPLFWCPQSNEWMGLQATHAQSRNDFKTALYWYNRLTSRDPGAAWALYNSAIIYGEQHDRANFERTVSRLRATDKDRAQELERAFGSG